MSGPSAPVKARPRELGGGVARRALAGHATSSCAHEGPAKQDVAAVRRGEEEVALDEAAVVAELQDVAVEGVGAGTIGPGLAGAPGLAAAEVRAGDRAAAPNTT